MTTVFFFRLDFIQDYTLKSLRLKQDKWNKLVLSDGQREYILSFIEKGEKCTIGLNIRTFLWSDFPQELIISQNIGGQLQVQSREYYRCWYIYNVIQVHTDWPSPLRNKGVFFVKREAKPIPEDAESVVDHMTCGDIHPNTLGIILSIISYFQARVLFALDHFCALVEEVFVPIFRNELNMAKFPQCVSDGELREIIPTNTFPLNPEFYLLMNNLYGNNFIPLLINNQSGSGDGMEITLISFQTLSDRFTSCQQVFIKSAATSRGKPFYPSPRKASYVHPPSRDLTPFKNCRGQRTLTRRNARLWNPTARIVTWDWKITLRGLSSNGDTRSVEKLLTFQFKCSNYRQRRFLARTVLQSWRMGRPLDPWLRSSSGRQNVSILSHCLNRYKKLNCIVKFIRKYETIIIFSN